MNNKEENKDKGPPLFRKWSGWYKLLIINLLVLIALFYWFMKYFS